MPYARQIAFAAVALAMATVATAADRRQTYAELAASADRVLIGSVGSRASHWGDDAHIYTDLLVYPDVAIKGDDSPVLVRVLGGTVGDTTMTVSDGPELPEGERVVLFLKREADRFVVVGRASGAVSAHSGDAAAIVEEAMGEVERAVGARLGAKRIMATAVLNRARGGASAGSASTRAGAQTGCYSVDGSKWSVGSATYKIGSTIPAGWSVAIDASTATWNAVNAGFRLVNDPTSVNELSYKDLVAAYGSSYSNTFAVTTTWTITSTGRISKATIEVNTKWPWSTAGEANMADVQNILTHEFGHWMRLLDIYSPSACSDVTMWGSASYGETKKRTLEQADIDGFRLLYTGATTTTPTVTAPTLASPANGSTGIAATPTLMWTASANATSYDVYFGPANGQPLVGTVTATSFRPGSLTAGATYYWRVVAKNSAGGASSTTFAFTVAAGTQPPPVTATLTLLSPADGATGVSTRPGISWTAVSGVTAYDVFIGTTSDPPRVGTVYGTTATVSGLRANTQYYWKVVARTATGSVTSGVASFRTN